MLFELHALNQLIEVSLHTRLHILLHLTNHTVLCANPMLTTSIQPDLLLDGVDGTTWLIGALKIFGVVEVNLAKTKTITVQRRLNCLSANIEHNIQ